MPTAAKRRKLAAPTKTPITRGIDSYSKVSKAVTTTSTTTKSLIEKDCHIDSIAIASKISSTNNRKRKKLDSDNDAPLMIECAELRHLTQRRPKESARSPQNSQHRGRIDVRSTSTETPTKGAGSQRDQLYLSSKSPTQSPPSDLCFSSNLDASTPTESPKVLPLELLDLINLHAAFLTTLSIHNAHNGTHSPADLRALCPDVARAWGKRQVLLEDIRRTLGVLNRTILDDDDDRSILRLGLSDYGHGKVCVEVQHGKGVIETIARPINEDSLNDMFVKSLRRAWREKEFMDLKAFIKDLPLEPITVCLSLAKMSSSLAKGERRLKDMRIGMKIKKKEKANLQDELANSPKLTLLERLRAKQIQQSTLPPPHTKAQMARRAALARIDEIIAVLLILSTSSSVGQSRISFTFPTVLGKLRDSIKTPMSKQEADECVRLLALEITPEWLRVVKMGRSEALLFNRDERPRDEIVRARIKLATFK